MQISTLAHNAVVVSHNDIDYLFSYDTLQAYHVWGELTVTAKPYVSRSTEKHINLFADYVGCSDNVTRADAESFYDRIE